LFDVEHLIVSRLWLWLGFLLAALAALGIDCGLAVECHPSREA
jgi:hypothetical protein